MSNMFRSSIGRKLLMSLAGLFLLSFLVVHLGINLLVLQDNRDNFNVAAHFMGTNPVIKVFEIVLFGGIFIHILVGLFLYLLNKKARPVGYKKENHSQTSFFSKYMMHSAMIILAFMVIHMFDFYFKAKFTDVVPDTIINGKHYHDLGVLVLEKFKMPLFVWGYIISMVFLAFHLHHGFQSAFQTLGINHKTYTPAIKAFGVGYAILVPLGFAIIPIVIYFFK
jgi:succinate dehydrogenase / fumarate reductase cytochrome b subunit